MPTYCYKCQVCGEKAEGQRPVELRDVRIGCPVPGCAGLLMRDQKRELKSQTGRTGRLPDWDSTGAGVCAGQVTEANKAYADLGVRFDSDGIAHVPGPNRQKFIKRRGLVELAEAPRRNRYAKTITAAATPLDIDGTGAALNKG